MVNVIFSTFLCHLMMQVCWTWTVTIFEFHRHLHHLWQWPRRDMAPFRWRAKGREWPKLVPKHCSNQFFGRAFISWSSQSLFQLVSHSGVLTLPALADRVPPAKCRRITFGLFHEWMIVPDFWVRMHTRSHSKQTDYGGLAITQTQTITATQPTIHPESWPQVFHLSCHRFGQYCHFLFSYRATYLKGKLFKGLFYQGKFWDSCLSRVEFFGHIS